MNVTYLFVPAHEERKAVRALGSDADAVIFDLEAAVPAREKSAARAALQTYLASRTEDGPEIWVRVNPGGREFDADLAGIDWRRVDGAVVAQADNPDVLVALERAGVTRLLPLIETVQGFAALERLGSVQSVERFGLGTWDLVLDLGLPVGDPDESELVWQLRGDLVVASRRLNLASPVDGVFARLDAPTEFRQVCQRGFRLGFTGKLLIHPNQIPIAQLEFGAEYAKVQWAREVIFEYERAATVGRGVIRFKGHMIDQPMVLQARALLARCASTVDGRPRNLEADMTVPPPVA
jgi:citrate lyase beta subunit